VLALCLATPKKAKHDEDLDGQSVLVCTRFALGDPPKRLHTMRIWTNRVCCLVLGNPPEKLNTNRIWTNRVSCFVFALCLAILQKFKQNEDLDGPGQVACASASLKTLNTMRIWTDRRPQITKRK
jgi:hypothetical protein